MIPSICYPSEARSFLPRMAGNLIPQGNPGPDYTRSFWMEVEPLRGSADAPKEGGILVIGSGLAGSSAAYWLQHYGFSDITMVDYEVEKSATFRNCGHILYGTVESMYALKQLHGAEAARELWDFSIEICHEVRDTISRLSIDADYRQDGYLVMAIDEVEDKEVRESVALLNSMGFQSDYVEAAELKRMGFRNVTGGRFEAGSAQAHPVKFRNGVLAEALRNGLSYHSGVQVLSVEDEGGTATVTTNRGTYRYDAVVIAANAYSPLLSRFFAGRKLVDPFRGQIITSKPLKGKLPVSYPHSFDHGYEYALRTPDNRLMIGGWRNHTPGGEIGTYDHTPTPLVEQGLIDFVRNHYALSEELEWEYSWSGIMAASRSGFPFIGPTTSPVIFTCAGCTGHGFSWFHGSAKLLAKIIAGEPIPKVARIFNPTA